MYRFTFLFIWTFLAVEVIGSASAFAGTVDGGGGGGNGIRNRLYESYIRNPMELPAYSSLEPIFEHLNIIWSDSSGSTKSTSNDSGTLGRWTLMKNWYFVPTAIDPLRKNQIGVSLLSEKTQQIARQTDTEVWIDSRVFDRMNLADQSDLLLHETMMSIYTFKYVKFSRLCALYRQFSTDQNCNIDGKYDVWLPPLPAKTHLDAEDHRNVRRMTDWLKVYGKTADAQMIRAAFLRNSFDRRFFAQRQVKEDQKSLSVTTDDIRNALAAAKAAGRMPNLCDAGSIKNMPCELTTSDDGPKKIGSWAMDSSLNFLIRKKDGTTSQTWISGRTSLQLFAITNLSNDESYFASAGGNVSEEAKIGARTTQIFYVWKFRETNAGRRLDLQALVLTPVVITSVSPEHGGTCSGELIRSNRSEDSSVVIHVPNFAADEALKATTEQSSEYVSCAFPEGK